MYDDVAAAAGLGVSVPEGEGGERRLLTTLQRLLAIEATSATDALAQVVDHIAAALGVEKVDAFLYDPARDALVALGVSDTPLGQRERAIGLDVLPLEGGDRTVETFRTGRIYMTGHADRDPAQLAGFTDGLGIRSMLLVPFAVGDERRGVLGVDSPRPDAFAADDRRFLEAVAHWVGVVVHRAELAARVSRAAAERAGHAAAEAERARLLDRERAARAAAEAAVRLRNDFLTGAAHDLRTPLTNMLGRLQLIGARLHRADGGVLDPDWLRGQLDSAAASTQRLLGTVNELGDMARLQAGEALELDRAPVDLGALVHAAVEDVAVAGGESGPSGGAHRDRRAGCARDRGGRRGAAAARGAERGRQRRQVQPRGRAGPRGGAAGRRAGRRRRARLRGRHPCRRTTAHLRAVLPRLDGARDRG